MYENNVLSIDLLNFGIWDDRWITAANDDFFDSLKNLEKSRRRNTVSAIAIVSPYGNDPTSSIYKSNRTLKKMRIGEDERVLIGH